MADPAAAGTGPPVAADDAPAKEINAKTAAVDGNAATTASRGPAKSQPTPRQEGVLWVLKNYKAISVSRGRRRNRAERRGRTAGWTTLAV